MKVGDLELGYGEQRKRGGEYSRSDGKKLLYSTMSVKEYTRSATWMIL